MGPDGRPAKICLSTTGRLRQRASGTTCLDFRREVRPLKVFFLVQATRKYRIDGSSTIMFATLMRILPAAVAIAILYSAAWSASSSVDVVGVWEGESKCTVANSPCRDEHVVYRISANKDNPKKLTIDADKIVNGSPQFMGTIGCEYHAGQSLLTCTANTPKQDEWELRVAGDTMTGTLKIGVEKTLYRRIAVRKK